MFTLHSLVHASLSQEATRELAQEELFEVRKDARELLRNVADPVELMALMLATGDDDHVFPFVAANFSYLSLNRTQDVIALLEPLSEERFRTCPSLATVLAIALSEKARVPSQRVYRLARIAEEVLTLEASSAPAAAEPLNALAIFALLRVTRQYEPAAERGRSILTLIENSDSSGWNASKVQILITEILAGNFSQAASMAYLINNETHAGRRLHLQSLQALAQTLAGNYPEADTYIAAIGADVPEGWNGTLYAIGWHVARAFQAEREGDTAGGLDRLEPIRGIFDVIELWPAVLFVYGKLLLSSGDSQSFDKFNALYLENRDRPLSGTWAAILSDVHEELSRGRIDDQLSRRELVVLSHLDTDKTLPEIAKKLHVSVNTIKTQTRHIYRKLNVSSREDAVRRARVLGFVNLGQRRPPVHPSKLS